MVMIAIGVLLLFGGMLLIADRAIWNGRLSGRGPWPTRRATNETLEPRTSGGRAFRIEENWFGLALMATGGVLLLIAAAYGV